MAYEIGDTLKKYRNNSGISVKQISDVLTQKGFKASESTIYSWENGNSQPTPGALLVMCETYGISDVLSAFGYDGYNPDGSIQLNMDEISFIERYRNLDQIGKKFIASFIDHELERMSMLKDAQKKKPAFFVETTPRHMPTSTRSLPYYLDASAGNGIYQFADAGSSTISVPIDVKGADIADFVLKVNGHSMEPDYNDGEFVMVSQSQPVKIGDVGIFIINGSSYIKERGETELISRNPEFDNIPVHDYDSFFCAGKVVGKF